MDGIDTEAEFQKLQKQINKWKRWSKKQPSGGGLPFDTWLREAPSAKTIVQPQPIKHAPTPGTSEYEDEKRRDNW